MRDNQELRKYAGMAFQILATLGVAFFIGYKLDEYFALSFPIFLISLPVIALIGFLYQVVRDTNKK
jgi:F0F1-type ATP synthase assembly protein I